MIQNTYCMRHTLRFPGLTGSPGVPAALSIPGPPDAGTFLNCTVQATIPRPIQSGAARNIEQSSQRLQFGKLIHNGLPLAAIAISPDSAIHSCLVSISGSSSEIESFRCSPGNPVTIPAGVNQVWISQISGIPVINSFDLTGIAWDAVEHTGPYATTTDGKTWAFPLRLLIMYGEIPAMVEVRSPYHGNIKIATGLQGQITNYFFCVDGRRQVNVSATLVVGGSGTGTTGVTVSAALCRGFVNAALPNEDTLQSVPVSVTPAGLLTVVAPSAGTPILFRVDSPSGALLPSWPILKITLNSTAGTGGDAAIVTVDAFD